MQIFYQKYLFAGKWNSKNALLESFFIYTLRYTKQNTKKKTKFLRTA